MRIGVVVDKFPSMSETFIIQHIVGLIDAGHEVTIFGRRPPGGTGATLHPDVVTYGLLSRVRYLPHQQWSPRQALAVPHTFVRSLGRPGLVRCLNPFRYGPGVLRFRALHGLAEVSRGRFDLLHCHYASIGWALLPYRDVFDVPLVTSFHGDHYGKFGEQGGWLLRKLFTHGDAFVANSNFTRGELLRLGCPDAKIHVIPAIVNDTSVAFHARASLRLPVRLLTVARIHESKGIGVALCAIRELLRRGRKVTYTIVGDGPHRARFENLSRSLGIGHAVQFLGWMNSDEVYAEYRNADIFVLPSIGSCNGANEAQGVVIQEAQLHGVPVVASRLGGVVESVDHGRAGRLFRPGDFCDLVRSLEALLDDTGELAGLTHHAAQYVRRKYTREAVVPKLEQLYSRLLGDAPGAQPSAFEYSMPPSSR